MLVYIERRTIRFSIRWMNIPFPSSTVRSAFIKEVSLDFLSLIFKNSCNRAFVCSMICFLIFPTESRESQNFLSFKNNILCKKGKLFCSATLLKILKPSPINFFQNFSKSERLVLNSFNKVYSLLHFTIFKRWRRNCFVNWVVCGNVFHIFVTFRFSLCICINYQFINFVQYLFFRPDFNFLSPVKVGKKLEHRLFFHSQKVNFITKYFCCGFHRETFETFLL